MSATRITVAQVVDACFAAGTAHVEESRAVLASAKLYSDAAMLVASALDAPEHALSLREIATGHAARLAKITDKVAVKELKRSGAIPTDATGVRLLANVGRVILQGGPLGILKIAGEDVVVTPRHVAGWLQAKGGDSKIAVTAEEFAEIIASTDTAETAARALYRAVKAAKSRKVAPVVEPGTDGAGTDGADESAGGVLSVPAQRESEETSHGQMLRNALALVTRAADEAAAWTEDEWVIADGVIAALSAAYRATHEGALAPLATHERVADVVDVAA